MCQQCNKYLIEAQNLANQLIELADKGDSEREDIGCGILFGTMRDCGYKLRALAGAEIENHKRQGIWYENEVSPRPDKSVSLYSVLD